MASQKFGDKWVDEKVLNFLEFLQHPLRNAAQACDCDQLNTVANQLELARGAFLLCDAAQRDQYKLMLYSYTQQLQALLVEEDRSEGVEQLSPEKLQLGFKPKLQDVHAEHLKQFCDAFVHILQNMDYGKLARYLTMFGEQAFNTSLHCALPEELQASLKAQLQDGNNDDDADAEQEQSAPSSISSDE